MMKIIKTPHYKVRCPYCACHFTFEREDFYDDYAHCPFCHRSIRVRDEKHELLKTVKVRYEDEEKENK